MSYTIDIIDTLDPEVVMTIEHAMRKSIVLSWQGADQKDDLQVVGSSLRFTLIDESATDGYYDVLFTGDETRYLVTITHDATEAIVWQGHLLPDSYSEPYERALVDVTLEASDGLGRLKGKYLDDSFYRDEKSVIEIITACLYQTGLELPLYFTPAIENVIQKNYHQIYIDTLHFFEKEKKQDAYSILQTLMLDMVCCVYQCDNRWYVTALNRRQLLQDVYKHYDTSGNFVANVDFTRLEKPTKPLVTPVITMVPPYGQIEVTHPRVKVELPETINKEANDGWAITTGVIGQILATDWNGNGSYYAQAYAPDYKVALAVKYGNSFADVDLNKYVDLKSKIYVAPGHKFSFYLKVVPSRSPVYAYDTGAYHVNGCRVELRLNNVILQEFEMGFTVGENELSDFVEGDIIIQEHGLLDIRVYEPFCSDTGTIPHIKQFYFEDVKLEIIGFEDEFIVTDVINQDYTITKDLELTFADDYLGFSKAFLLAKLREQTTDYNQIDVPIFYGGTLDGQNYTVVSLEGANLIADNINTVYYDGQLLTDLEVIYNFNTGEEMVILTPNLITSGVFQVRVYKVNDVTGNRLFWQQWTDSIYQIEDNRYAVCVANVYRRMFNVPHYKIDMVLNQSVKFNDIVKFPYKVLQNYLITNCAWDLDANETTVTAIKGYYLNDIIENPTDNIPPIVDAGPDIYLSQTDNSATFDATAFDPDGFIVSHQWEKLSGPAGDVIATPTNEDTFVGGLTGDAYEYKITVTDNDGATASDTLKVLRIQQYNFANTISCTTDQNHGFGMASYQIRRRIFQLSVGPTLQPGTVLQVIFKFTVFQIVSNSNTDAGDYLGNPCVELGTPNETPNNKISKNGTIIYDHNATNTYVANVPVNLVAGDVIQVQIEAMQPNAKNTKCEILEIIDVTGNAEFTGLPLNVEAYDIYTPL